MLVIVGKVSVYIVLLDICVINVNQCGYAIYAFSYSTSTEEPQKERGTSMIAVIAILTVVVAIAGVFLSSVAS